MARKKSKKALEIDNFSSEDDVEEIGFDNLIVGSPVATFSFTDSFCKETAPATYPYINTPCISKSSIPPFTPTKEIKKDPIYNEVSDNIVNSSSEIMDHRRYRVAPNGITPPIDGEHFDIKRGYTFRKSTIRKLNELKAAHPDVNVYLSTIIDEAINHYFNYMFADINKS